MRIRFFTFCLLLCLLFPTLITAQEDDDNDDTIATCDYTSIMKSLQTAQLFLDDDGAEEAQTLIDNAITQLALCETETDTEEDVSERNTDPSVPVRGILTALLTGEGEVSNYVCDALEDEAVMLVEESIASVEEIGEFEMDLSGVEYTVSNQTEDSAEVSISGEIFITIAGQTVSEDVGELFGDPPIPVFKERGSWVVCDTTLIGG